MSEPFEQDPQIDFTAGTSVPLIRSDYEYCVAAIHYPLNALLGKIPIIELLRDRLDKNQESINDEDTQQLPPALDRYGLNKRLFAQLVPGGLGLGVKLSTWQSIGGMPDWLRASEDNLFGRKLMQTQARYKTCPGARLYHHMRGSPSALFNQMFVYTRGNGQTHHKRPLALKTAGFYAALLSCFLLPFALHLNIIILLALFLGYGYHQGVRKVRRIALQNFKLAYIPLSFAVLIPRDLGMLAGYLKGWYDWWTDPQYPIRYAQFLQREMVQRENSTDNNAV